MEEVGTVGGRTTASSTEGTSRRALVTVTILIVALALAVVIRATVPVDGTVGGPGTAERASLTPPAATR